MVAVTTPEKEGYVPYPKLATQPVEDRKRVPVRKPVTAPVGV